MPLTEPASDVAVLLQDAGKGGAAPGPRGRVPRERAWELSDRAKAYPVVVAAGQQPRTGRRAHGRDVEAVVRQPHLLHPRQVRGVDRAAEGAGGTETGVVDQDNQHVWCVIWRLRPGYNCPIGHRLIDGTADGPAEGSVGDRQGRTIRAELAGSFCQGILELLQAIFIHLGNRLRGRVGERPFGGQPIIALDHREDGRRAWLELIAEAFLNAAIELVLGELADQGTCCRADGDRSKQRWREEADHEANTSTPAHALATHVVAGLGHTHFTVRVMLDEDHPLGPQSLVFDQLDDGLKVLLGRLEALIASHDDIKGIFHCVLTFFAGLKRNPTKYSIIQRARAKYRLHPRIDFLLLV